MVKLFDVSSALGGPLLHAAAGQIVATSGQPILATYAIAELPPLGWAPEIHVVTKLFPHSHSGQTFLVAEVFALDMTGNQFKSFKTYRVDTGTQPYSSSLDADIERELKIAFVKL